MVLQTAAIKAMELKSTYANDSYIIRHFKNIFNILRDEMMQHKKENFNGTFDEFENPSHLLHFLSQTAVWSACSKSFRNAQLSSKQKQLMLRVSF